MRLLVPLPLSVACGRTPRRIYDPHRRLVKTSLYLSNTSRSFYRETVPRTRSGPEINPRFCTRCRVHPSQYSPALQLQIQAFYKKRTSVSGERRLSIFFSFTSCWRIFVFHELIVKLAQVTHLPRSCCLLQFSLIYSLRFQTCIDCVLAEHLLATKSMFQIWFFPLSWADVRGALIWLEFPFWQLLCGHIHRSANVEGSYMLTPIRKDLWLDTFF